jgi:hypothetical protein
VSRLQETPLSRQRTSNETPFKANEKSLDIQIEDALAKTTDLFTTFEAHIEKMICMCGVEVEQIFNALKTLQNSFYVEVLLSICDFSHFIDMLKHYKAAHSK